MNQDPQLSLDPRGPMVWNRRELTGSPVSKELAGVVIKAMTAYEEHPPVEQPHQVGTSTLQSGLVIGAQPAGLTHHESAPAPVRSALSLNGRIGEAPGWDEQAIDPTSQVGGGLVLGGTQDIAPQPAPVPTLTTAPSGLILPPPGLPN